MSGTFHEGKVRKDGTPERESKLQTPVIPCSSGSACGLQLQLRSE